MQRSGSPEISATMAVFNVAPFVSKAVESILAQTIRNLELLIIDDGSTDHSLKILERYARADDRIRLWSRPHRGAAAARNELIDLARAPVIAVMDGDDIAAPDRFERQLAYLDSHLGCVAVGSRVRIIDSDGHQLTSMFHLQTHREIDDANIRGLGSAMCHPSVTMRRDRVLGVGKYDVALVGSIDLDLFLRLAEAGGCLANLPDVLLEYRAHHGSISNSQFVRQRTDGANVRRAARLRRGLPIDPSTINPSLSQCTPAESHRKWGWWALRDGQVATARKHAMQSLRRSPFSHASWQLFACALRGY